MMKLIPDNDLQASVDITNKDIGFMSLGLPVTVAVDSFPSGEFGYIKGSLSSLGSDACHLMLNMDLGIFQLLSH